MTIGHPRVPESSADLDEAGGTDQDAAQMTKGLSGVGAEDPAVSEAPTPSSGHAASPSASPPASIDAASVIESAAISIRGITKTFVTKQRKGLFKSTKGTVEALRAIDLDVKEGELFGLLGPNGAGKTTLIKCLTTLLVPDAGDVTINGYSLPAEEAKVRASLGCMLMGERGLYWKLSGRENLHYFAALYHVPPKDIPARVQFLIDDLELGEFIDRTVETYSSGQKMITSFAKALIADPPILFLDEPTATIDVPNARRLRSKVKELHRSGKTIVYTTHMMHEADELCERIAIIDHGAIIATGVPGELKAAHQETRAVDVTGSFPASTRETLLATEGIENVIVGEDTEQGSVLTIHTRKGVPLQVILGVLEAKGATIQAIDNHDPTLEDVFVALTGRSLAVDTATSATKEGGEGGGGP